MSWQELTFGNFAEIQPQVALEKGTDYSFIEMADVVPHTKMVIPGSTRIWKGSGGSKFENGDIIFARITPCLEHGKTAKVSNLTDSKGFGSTEFFVFRGREGISDPDYIYYLARSPVIREPAIKSMTGASGRQRAQKIVVENTSIRVPELQEQRRIASILSAYDDLIENNLRRIQLLEQSAQLLYKEWFVHLRFPGHEHVTIIDGVPEGWEKKNALEVMDVLSGGTPKTSVPDYWNGEIPFFTSKDTTDYAYIFSTERTLTEEGLRNCSSRLYPKDTVFITARGTVGKINLAQTDMAMNQSCYALVAKPPLNQQFLYFAMVENVEQFRSRAVGAIFDAIIRNTFKLIPFVVPDIKLIDMFTGIISPILQQIDILSTEIRKLTQARDILLPRLMNGDITLENQENQNRKFLIVTFCSGK